MPLGSIPCTTKNKIKMQFGTRHGRDAVIPVLGRLRQKDHRFKTSLRNTVRLSATKHDHFKIKDKTGLRI